MKVLGNVISSGTALVQIDPRQFLLDLKQKWLKSQYLPEKAYIVNSTDPYWETWDDYYGHGSGEYEYIRAVADDELVTWNAFDVLLSRIRFNESAFKD